MRALLISHRPLLASIASRLSGQFECVGATSIAGAWSLAGRAPVDLILLDLSSTGGQSFAAARDALPAAPIVVLSDDIDGDDALDAIAQGADEAIPLDAVGTSHLARAVRFAIARHQSTEPLRTAAARYAVLIDRLPIAAYTCDADGVITSYNAKAVELWGRVPELDDASDRYDDSFRLFARDGTPIVHDAFWMARALADGVGYNGRECLLQRADGTRRRVLAHANPVHDSRGRLVGAVNVLVDITDSGAVRTALPLRLTFDDSRAGDADDAGYNRPRSRR